MKFAKTNPRKEIKVAVTKEGNIISVDLTDINRTLLENDKHYVKTVFDYFIHSIEKLSYDTSNSIFNFNTCDKMYRLETQKATLYRNNRKHSRLRMKGNNIAHEGFNYYADGRYAIILLYRLAAVLYEIVSKGIIRTTYNTVTVNHTRNDGLTHAQSVLLLDKLEITTNEKNLDHGRIWNYIFENSVSRIKTDFLSSNTNFIKYIERFVKNGDKISEEDLIKYGAQLDSDGYYVIR